MSDMERLELYEKLERAEGRIVSLEKQVCDNLLDFTSLVVVKTPFRASSLGW